MSRETENLMVYQPNHKHHNVWREYTENLLKGVALELEYRYDRKGGSPSRWCNLKFENIWDTDYQIRVKGAYIDITVNNCSTSIRPYKGRLNKGELYYVPNIANTDMYGTVSSSTYPVGSLQRQQAIGVLHLSPQDAIQHTKALLGIRELI